MPTSEDLKVEDAPKMEMKSDKPKPNFFEFGDVFFECNRCGNYERLQKGVKDGMQFVLPTSDQHEWRLVCGKCENMMRIFFKESDEVTIAAAKEQIELEEKEAKKKAEDEALEKARENESKENESKEKDKKKRPSKRNSKDTEGSDKSDREGDATLTIVD